MEVLNEATVNIYKEAISSLRKEIGRFIYAIQNTAITSQRDCPNCRFDTVTGKSSGEFEAEDPYPSDVVGPVNFRGLCPVCRGEGKLGASDKPLTKSIKIKANVWWLEGRERRVAAFGEEEEADIWIRNVQLKYEGDIIKAKHFLVDGEKAYLLKRPVKEGLRDIIKISFYLKYEKPVKQND